MKHTQDKVLHAVQRSHAQFYRLWFSNLERALSVPPNPPSNTEEAQRGHTALRRGWEWWPTAGCDRAKVIAGVRTVAEKRMNMLRTLPPASRKWRGSCHIKQAASSGCRGGRTKVKAGKCWALRTPVEGSLPVSIRELISGILQVRRWGLGNLPEEPTTPWGTQKQPCQLEKMSRENGGETATTGSPLHRQTCKK